MMLKPIEVIVTHLVHNNTNNYFWGLSQKNKWNNQKAKANIFHYPFPFDGTDAGGLFGAGEDGGVFIGFGSLIGLETLGVLGSGVLKLIVGLAGSDVGLLTGSYSLGFDVCSTGLVGIGCA